MRSDDEDEADRWGRGGELVGQTQLSKGLDGGVEEEVLEVGD